MIPLEMVRKKFPEVRVSTSSGHTEYTVNCRKPHKKGGRYKLSINADTGVFYCNDCGWTGNAWDVFFDDLAGHFELLKRIRGDIDAPTMPSHTYVKQGYSVTWGSSHVPAPGECLSVYKLAHDHPAVLYLAGRGFDLDQMEKEGFDVRYCREGQVRFNKCPGAEAEGRIVFPITEAGDIVGWQARMIDRVVDEETRWVWRGEAKGWVTVKKAKKVWADHGVPKYGTMPGMRRGTVLFNGDAAKKYPFVIPVEGPLDAVRIGHPAVATLGKIITSDQCRILKTYWQSVVLIQDDDIFEDGNPVFKENYERMLADLGNSCRVFAFPLKGYHDPGEAPRLEIWDQIKKHIKEHS